MKNKIEVAEGLLRGSGVSLVDAARIVKNMLDFMPSCARFTPVQFCSKIADLGCKHFRLVEMQVKDAFPLYVK